MSEIASLPLREQGEAMRAAMVDPTIGVRCPNCNRRYGVRGSLVAAQHKRCPNCDHAGLELDR